MARAVDTSGLQNALAGLGQSNALVAQRREQERLRRNQAKANGLRTFGTVAGAVAGSFVPGGTLAGASAGAALGGALGGAVASSQGLDSGGNTARDIQTGLSAASTIEGQQDKIAQRAAEREAFQAKLDQLGGQPDVAPANQQLIDNINKNTGATSALPGPIEGGSAPAGPGLASAGVPDTGQGAFPGPQQPQEGIPLGVQQSQRSQVQEVALLSPDEIAEARTATVKNTKPLDKALAKRTYRKGLVAEYQRLNPGADVPDSVRLADSEKEGRAAIHTTFMDELGQDVADQNYSLKARRQAEQLAADAGIPLDTRRKFRTQWKGLADGKSRDSRITNIQEQLLEGRLLKQQTPTKQQTDPINSGLGLIHRLDGLSDKAEKLPAGIEGGFGLVRAAAPVGAVFGIDAAEDIQSFDIEADSLRGVIVRDVLQEKGTLTEFDQRRAEKLQPRSDDPPAIRKFKTKMLRHMTVANLEREAATVIAGGKKLPKLMESQLKQAGIDVDRIKRGEGMLDTRDFGNKALDMGVAVADEKIPLADTADKVNSVQDGAQYIDKNGDLQVKTPATRPTSKADFDALPKGTWFINPKDGKRMRKK